MHSVASSPPGWPDGKPLALSVSVMLEGWTDDSAPGIGPMGNPLKAGVLDLQARSWAEYGPKVGAWRLLDILHKLDVRSVFYVSGILAERYRNTQGEIDIVAYKKKTIVAVEVKARQDFAQCAETITPWKQQKITRRMAGAVRKASIVVSIAMRAARSTGNR